MGIEQENLHMKFSALNVKFCSLSLINDDDDRFNIKSSPYGDVKSVYPLQNALLMHVVH